MQPALSRQIRILEQELDTQLLIRHRRGIALTEAGELLREHAATIMAALDEARHAVSSVGGEPSGKLAVGLPTSVLDVLSTELIHKFCQSYPRVSLQVFEAQGHIVESYLREGRIDLAVLISPKPMAGISLEPLASEHVHLVGPAGAGLDMAEPVSLEAVARVPMIMFPSNNKVRQTVEDALHRRGLAFTQRIEVEGQPLTLSLVQRGLGYTMMPRCLTRVETSAGRLSGAPIDGATMSWELGVQRVRAGAPAVKALVAMLRNAASDGLDGAAGGDGGQLPSRKQGSRRKSSVEKSVDK